MTVTRWQRTVNSLCILIGVTFVSPVNGQPAAANGAGIYAANCATCHENAAFKAPPAVSLATMSQSSLMAAMTTGQMAAQAEELGHDEKVALIEALTQREWQSQSIAETAYCNHRPKAGEKILWSGWGGDVRSSGFSVASDINRNNIDTLDVAWVFGFPGATRSRSQPAVVGDLVVIGSQLGQVYALDLDSGCIHWMFGAASAVRGAVSVAVLGGRNAVFFADFRSNVYALDALTGDLIWQAKAGHSPYSSVTGSVTIADDRVYVPIASTEVISAADPDHVCCTSSGAVVALSKVDGGILWRHLTVPESARTQDDSLDRHQYTGSSGAPVWSSPTVDSSRGLVYVGTGQNYSRPTTATSDAILALYVDTGKLAWSFQGFESDAFNIACVIPGRENNCPAPPNPDIDFGMAPIVANSRLAGDVLIAGQKSGVVYALDPDTGKLRWQKRIGLGGPNGGIHWGMTISGELAIATVSDRLSGIARVDPEGQPMPGVYALELTSGRVVWTSQARTDTCRELRGCYAAYSAAPTSSSELVFSGGLDGWIRVFDVATGKPLWRFNTRKTFQTVNDVEGAGGSIDGPGPVLVRDTLLVNSGYGLNQQMPGNVLIAFRPGK